MLTSDQRGKLAARENLSLNDRKTNEFVVRKNITKWIDGADDLVFALTTLPEKQSKRVLTNQGISKLSAAMVKALHTIGTPYIIDGKFTSLDTIPIHEKTDLPTRPGPVRGFKQTLREATAEELERAEIIKHLINELIDCLGEADIKKVIEDLEKVVES